MQKCPSDSLIDSLIPDLAKMADAFTSALARADAFTRLGVLSGAQVTSVGMYASDVQSSIPDRVAEMQS